MGPTPRTSITALAWWQEDGEHPQLEFQAMLLPKMSPNQPNIAPQTNTNPIMPSDHHQPHSCALPSTQPGPQKMQHLQTHRDPIAKCCHAGHAEDPKQSPPGSKPPQNLPRDATLPAQGCPPWEAARTKRTVLVPGLRPRRGRPSRLAARRYSSSMYRRGGPLAGPPRQLQLPGACARSACRRGNGGGWLAAWESGTARRRRRRVVVKGRSEAMVGKRG